tara:strand:- start:128 stop:1204 length:1077 start_codon:yes stop_codon:yes gene_type:complete
MLLFKKKIYFNLYIFFLILFSIINEFSTNIAYAKNFIISDIEIEESYDLNFNKSEVIDKGFDKAFKILIYKTIETKDRFKFENISLKKIKSLIDNFSIIDEKFIDNKYKNKLEVEFNRKKTLNFFEDKNIISSIPKEIKPFFLPILIDTEENELYPLNKNIFFKNWNNKPQKYFLINYVLPNEDIEDYLIIKKNIKDIENYKFNEIIKKYNLESYIILIILKNNDVLRIFSKIKFGKKNILMNNFYNRININNENSINSLIFEIKDSYEDRWKSLNKLNTLIAFPLRLSFKSNNINLSRKLEKTLEEYDLVTEYKIEKFNSKDIIYKIIFNSSPDKFLDKMFSVGFSIDTTNDIWKIK